MQQQQQSIVILEEREKNKKAFAEIGTGFTILRRDSAGILRLEALIWFFFSFIYLQEVVNE